MKGLKLLLLFAFTSFILITTSFSIKAQDYGSCPVSYQEIEASISEAIEADNLFSFSDIASYPINSYVTLGKLKNVYSDPRCRDYKPQLKSDLRSFWEIVAEKKYFHFRKQAQLSKLSCDNSCLSSWVEDISSCKQSCNTEYQRKLSEIQSDESTEDIEISDFFRS